MADDAVGDDIERVEYAATSMDLTRLGRRSTLAIAEIANQYAVRHADIGAAAATARLSVSARVWQRRRCRERGVSGSVAVVVWWWWCGVEDMAVVMRKRRCQCCACEGDSRPLSDIVL